MRRPKEVTTDSRVFMKDIGNPFKLVLAGNTDSIQVKFGCRNSLDIEVLSQALHERAFHSRQPFLERQ